MSNLTFWVIFGFVGQFIFGSRFVVQWIASERRKESFIPQAFWYLSILGSVILLSYAIHKKDPVFITGQCTGLFIYFRNIILISKKNKSSVSEMSS